MSSSNLLKKPSLKLSLLIALSFINLFPWQTMAADARINEATTPTAANATKSLSPPLASYSAQYILYWHGLRAGVSSHQLTQLKDGSYRLNADATPSIAFLPYRYTETSYFKVSNNQIIPNQYITKGEEGGKNKEGHLKFDWTQGTVSNVISKKIWQHPIEVGTQDKLSYNLMLRADLMQGQTLLKYKVVEDSHLREYHFVHLGQSSLKTSLGMLDTVMLEHTNPLNQRKTKLWLSPKHDYIIVKMEQYRKNKLFIRGEISKLQFQAQPSRSI